MNELSFNFSTQPFDGSVCLEEFQTKVIGDNSLMQCLNHDEPVTSVHNNEAHRENNIKLEVDSVSTTTCYTSNLDNVMIKPFRVNPIQETNEELFRHHHPQSFTSKPVFSIEEGETVSISSNSNNTLTPAVKQEEGQTEADRFIMTQGYNNDFLLSSEREGREESNRTKQEQLVSIKSENIEKDFLPMNKQSIEQLNHSLQSYFAYKFYPTSNTTTNINNINCNKNQYQNLKEDLFSKTSVPVNNANNANNPNAVHTLNTEFTDLNLNSQSTGNKPRELNARNYVTGIIQEENLLDCLIKYWNIVFFISNKEIKFGPFSSYYIYSFLTQIRNSNSKIIRDGNDKDKDKETVSNILVEDLAEDVFYSTSHLSEVFFSGVKKYGEKIFFLPHQSCSSQNISKGDLSREPSTKVKDPDSNYHRNTNTSYPQNTRNKHSLEERHYNKYTNIQENKQSQESHFFLSTKADLYDITKLDKFKKRIFKQAYKQSKQGDRYLTMKRGDIEGLF
mmetsp:Transcript_25638/g.26739  ORF Transcript_25638/g.26739 Transcript_25638/m.26739 type:complete len:505 (+) Transcript_25638:137-1651(+)